MIIKCNKGLYINTDHISRYEIIVDKHGQGIIRAYTHMFSTDICKTPTLGIAEAILKEIAIAIYKGNKYHEITGNILPLNNEVTHGLQ